MATLDEHTIVRQSPRLRPARRPSARRQSTTGQSHFYRTYQAAPAKLADSTGELRPTAARVLKALRADGRLTTDQLTAALAERGRAIRAATVQVALGELVAAKQVAATGEDGQQRWLAPPTARDPLLEAVDLHGAHYRHTTPETEMAARIATAIEQRLRLVLEVAEQAARAPSICR